MNMKTLCLVGAFAMAAPVAASAAPAGGLTADTFRAVATAPQSPSAAAVNPGDAPARVENVWYRRWGGWGYRRFGYYGFRGPYYGYGFRGPYAGYYGFRRPFGFYGRRF